MMDNPLTPAEILARFEADAAAATEPDAVERIRNAYLGRNGLISGAFDSIGKIAPDLRKAFGRDLNLVKTKISDWHTAMREASASSMVNVRDDLTLPGVPRFRGTLHPLTQVLDEVIDIFHGLGFIVESGPEAELISYNFDKLNTPPWHPARDLTDTFYLDTPARDRLLRTETSPVQIRVMESRKPPIRIIAPGRVYRSDKPDATHSPIFMQVEGLYVDKGVTFADLKGTVLAFYRGLYGKDVKTRFRPHFFPFTEPSAEVDVSCIFCGGAGCRICKQSGWLEMGGSGMVDPNVLTGVGIDPEIYSGWAFGLGVERIALLKYGIDDIRLLYENDLRFLTQF